MGTTSSTAIAAGARHRPDHAAVKSLEACFLPAPIRDIWNWNNAKEQRSRQVEKRNLFSLGLRCPRVHGVAVAKLGLRQAKAPI